MAKIIFTHSEVMAAMPKSEGAVGSANAWELYASMAGAEEAAKTINMILLQRLTDPVVGVNVDFGNIERLANSLHDEVYKTLRISGQTFGWGDTEPRWQLMRMFRNLFQTED